MSTNSDDITIDLDEIDRKLAEDKSKDAKADPIEVIRAEDTEKPASKQVLKPEDGLEALKKQLQDESQAREEAEHRATQAAESEARALADAQQNQLHLITSSIDKFEQANQILKSNFKQAAADQDYEQMAEIQAAMAENAANLLQLKQGKSALERAPKPQPRLPADPVEQFVMRMTPASASWIRAHRECVTDPKKNAKMIAAHDFIKDDVAVDSPEYFQRIEEMLGYRNSTPDPKLEDDPMADAAKPSRRSQPAAAPVTRSGNGAGNRPNAVTLTAAEREMAAMSGLTDEEYARNKIALKKDGRLN